MSSEGLQYSIPYTVSLAVLEGDVGPRQVTEIRTIDPKLRELATRVEVVIDPEMDALFPQQAGAMVEIETADNCFQTRVVHPRGDVQNPLTDNELESRFLIFASSSLGGARAEQLLTTLKDLQKVESMTSVGHLLRRGHLKDR